VAAPPGAMWSVAAADGAVWAAVRCRCARMRAPRRRPREFHNTFAGRAARRAELPGITPGIRRKPQAVRPSAELAGIGRVFRGLSQSVRPPSADVLRDTRGLRLNARHPAQPPRRAPAGAGAGGWLLPLIANRDHERERRGQSRWRGRGGDRWRGPGAVRRRGPGQAAGADAPRQRHAPTPGRPPPPPPPSASPAPRPWRPPGATTPSARRRPRAAPPCACAAPR
jgi:hypothetical protein